MIILAAHLLSFLVVTGFALCIFTVAVWLLINILCFPVALLIVIFNAAVRFMKRQIILVRGRR